MDSLDAPLWIITGLQGQRGCDICVQRDAFVASLSVCAQNKDLVKDISIHDVLVQREIA